VQYIGFFSVDEPVPEGQMGRMVAVTAPSILYSSIRELLALLTGRGPMPCLLLPVVTFIDHDSMAQAFTESEATQEGTSVKEEPGVEYGRKKSPAKGRRKVGQRGRGKAKAAAGASY
jgi:preprotein translocase subunit SecB